MTSKSPDTPALPVPLLVACVVTALEGVLMLGLAVAELADFTSPRATMVLSNAAWFLIYGLFLLFCARALAKLQSWARPPVVMAQLLQLGLAWDFRPYDTVWLAVVITLVSLVPIIGILHPASVKAVADAQE